MALSLAAGLTLSPKDLLAAGGGIYPPARTGLRGSHPGSFEAAHKIAWEGWRPERPSSAKDGPYDLVIVGGGLSGLAAAFTYQQRAGKDARILILDNHDDFGGHAKRNEFSVLGRLLIGYGGSQSIDGPAGYSKEAQALLRAIGVETQRFYDAYDQGFYARHGMGYGMFFDAEHYGVNRLTPNPWRWDGGMDNGGLEAALMQMPITPQTRAALDDLFVGRTSVLADLPLAQRIPYLQKTSYENLLRDVFHCPEEAVVLLRNTVKTFWGLGWDALSALEAARLAMPGTQRLGIEGHIPDTYDREEPYIFHFPDGNAGLARLLVAHLIPAVSTARTMDSCILDKPNYARLDTRENKVRIRLNATVADVRHRNDGVDVTYIRDGRAERVEAKAVIMACWHNIIPHICPELPENQAQAMGYGTKVPLLYVNVALRNWRAFADAGYHNIYSPQAPFPDMALDFPVSMGGYEFSKGPDEPIILHMADAPTQPGLSSHDQHRAGRAQIYQTSFAEYEERIRAQLIAMLGGYGFDFDRDVAGLTLNRWPHGYAYEYNELWDDVAWGPDNGPHVTARRPFGSIAIANSDASAYAYVDGAFDAAVRAVNDIMGGSRE